MRQLCQEGIGEGFDLSNLPYLFESTIFTFSAQAIRYFSTKPFQKPKRIQTIKVK
jgi:hypothetical protein